MVSDAPKAEFMLRQLTKDDLPFLFNSFLKSFRDAPAMVGIPNALYYASQHALIERLMASAGSRVLVACSKDDPSQIYGYGLGEVATVGSVIHWIYVKHPFRGFGIGKTLEQALIQSNPVTVFFTHRVKPLERLLKNRTGYTYNPFLLMDLK
jgi:GNAT superfamily N-acetyltransferase